MPLAASAFSIRLFTQSLLTKKQFGTIAVFSKRYPFPQPFPYRSHFSNSGLHAGGVRFALAIAVIIS
jgi:hypothetical protein